MRTCKTGNGHILAGNVVCTGQTTQLGMCVCIRVCMCVCMHACVHVYIRVNNLYILITIMLCVSE